MSGTESGMEALRTGQTATVRFRFMVRERGVRASRARVCVFLEFASKRNEGTGFLRLRGVAMSCAKRGRFENVIYDSDGWGYKSTAGPLLAHLNHRVLLCTTANRCSSFFNMSFVSLYIAAATIVVVDPFTAPSSPHASDDCRTRHAVLHLKQPCRQGFDGCDGRERRGSPASPIHRSTNACVLLSPCACSTTASTWCSAARSSSAKGVPRASERSGG